MANISDSPEISHQELRGADGQVPVGGFDKEASVSISRLLAGVPYGDSLPAVAGHEAGEAFVRSIAGGFELYFLEPAQDGESPGRWVKHRATADLLEAKFTLPSIARTRLRTTAANTAVTHAVSSFGGSAVVGVAEPSAVNNVGRLTMAADGGINLTVVDTLRLLSAQAGDTEGVGIISLVVRQYSSTGTLKRVLPPWSAPITRSVASTYGETYLMSVTSGLIDVKSGDFFTAELEWEHEDADRSVEFQLPSGTRYDRVEIGFAGAVGAGQTLTREQIAALINRALNGYVTLAVLNARLAALPSGGGSGGGLTADQQAVLQKAVEVDSIQLDGNGNLFFGSDGGQTATIEIGRRLLPTGNAHEDDYEVRYVASTNSYKLAATPSASGGLSETQVDARVRALVAATYLSGNTALIALAKLPVDELDRRYAGLSTGDEARIADLERRSGYDFETFNLLNAHSVVVDTSHAQYALDATLSVPPETRESTLTLKVQGHGEATFLLSDFYAKPVLAGSARFDTADVISYTNGGDTFYLGRDAGGKFRFGSDTGDTYSVSLDLNQYRGFPDGAGHGGDLIGFKEDPRGGLDAVDITPLVNRLIAAHGSSGLTEAQAEALIVSWAKANNPTGRIPEKLLPEDLDHLLDAISDGGWRDVATADVGVPQQAKWTTSAIRALAESAWHNGLPPISPRRENQWIPVRVLVADKDKVESGDWELRNDTVPSISGTEFERAGDDLESSPTFAYYQVQVPNLPVGETPRISRFERFSIDTSKVKMTPAGGVYGQYATPSRDGDDEVWIYPRPDPVSALPTSFETGERIILDTAVIFQPRYDVTVASLGTNAAGVRNVTGASGGATHEISLIRYGPALSLDAQIRNQLVLEYGTAVAGRPLAVAINGTTYNLSAALNAPYQRAYIVQAAPAWTAGSERSVAIITTDHHNLPAQVAYAPGDYTAVGKYEIEATPGAQAPWASVGNTDKIPRTKLPAVGLTILNDGARNGLAVNSSSSDYYSAGGVQGFATAFDLDDDVNSVGKIDVESVVTLNNRSTHAISFSASSVVTQSRATAFSFSSKVKSSTSYSASARNGIEVASFDVFESAVKLGTVKLFLAKDNDNVMGTYAYYDGETAGFNFNIAVSQEIAYESNDSSGGGGRTVGPNLLSSTIRGRSTSQQHTLSASVDTADEIFLYFEEDTRGNGNSLFGSIPSNVVRHRATIEYVLNQWWHGYLGNGNLGGLAAYTVRFTAPDKIVVAQLGTELTVYWHLTEVRAVTY